MIKALRALRIHMTGSHVPNTGCLYFLDSTTENVRLQDLNSCDPRDLISVNRSLKDRGISEKPWIMSKSKEKLRGRISQIVTSTVLLRFCNAARSIQALIHNHLRVTVLVRRGTQSPLLSRPLFVIASS